MYPISYTVAHGLLIDKANVSFDTPKFVFGDFSNMQVLTHLVQINIQMHFLVKHVVHVQIFKNKFDSISDINLNIMKNQFC